MIRNQTVGRKYGLTIIRLYPKPIRRPMFLVMAAPLDTKPPTEIMPYGTITSTPMILYNTHRTLEKDPQLKTKSSSMRVP